MPALEMWRWSEQEHLANSSSPISLPVFASSANAAGGGSRRSLLLETCSPCQKHARRQTKELGPVRFLQFLRDHGRGGMHRGHGRRSIKSPA